MGAVLEQQVGATAPVASGPVDEATRQRAVDALAVAPGEQHPRLDRITRLARLALDVPMAAVTVLDGDRAWFPSQQGLDTEWVPREETFCTVTTAEDADLDVTDASLDDRFDALPAVALGVRSYFGRPLRNGTGAPVATFCVFDTRPRALTEEQREVLEDLASWAERELVASQEMQQASRVQASLLPARPVRVGSWDVDGLCLPALAVGGDFYDYEVHSGVLHVSLGDVMGKGTGAALLGAATRTALRGTSSAVAAGVDLGVTVTHVARSLEADLDRAESFVTLVEAAVDLAEGRVRYVDAGSGLVLLTRPGVAPRALSGEDRPLGVFPEDHWTEHEVLLAPGDRLLLFSDGVLDLLDDATDWVAQVGAMVRDAADLPAFLTELARRAGSDAALDDITVVGVFRHLDEPTDAGAAP